VETQIKEVLNAEEAAELLGVNPYTLRQKARLGELPGRKVGKEWRFSRTALLEWLRDSEIPTRRPLVVELTSNPDGSGYLATVQGAPDISGRGKSADDAVRDVRAALEASSYANKYRTELP
jgi:excisionase family DNA binding protein